MKLVLKESIGMHCFDMPFLQFSPWKIFRLAVTITSAWPLIAAASTCLSFGSGSDQPSISGPQPEALNQGVPHPSVHQGAGALQLCCGQVGPVAQQCIGPFVVDGIGPSGEIKVSGGDFQQNIPNRRRIQNRRIQKCREPGHLQ